MALDTSIAQTALDFKGLAALRRSAATDKTDPETLKQVASQFEALFIGMMLKSMRQAKLAEGLFDNSQSALYRDMYDQQLAIEMAKKGGVGLQNAIIRQLGGQADKQEVGKKMGHQIRSIVNNRINSAQLPHIHHTAPKSEVSIAHFTSPEQFVHTLYPQAKKAADKLGVSPEVLLAQAALETGWGKHIINKADGSSSHNLFNIKANSRWLGDSVAKVTLEYRHGVAEKETAKFRAYPDYQASFDDYVTFLQTHSRYQQALQQKENPISFIEHLHKAGYATDPDYAEKVKRILRSPTLAQISQQLKYT